MAVQGMLVRCAAMVTGSASDALPNSESMAMRTSHSPADSGAKTTAYSLGPVRIAAAGPSRSSPRRAETTALGA